MSELAAIREREHIRRTPFIEWETADGDEMQRCPHCGEESLCYPETEIIHKPDCVWKEAQRHWSEDRDMLLAIAERAEALLAALRTHVDAHVRGDRGEVESWDVQHAVFAWDAGEDMEEIEEDRIGAQAVYDALAALDRALHPEARP